MASQMVTATSYLRLKFVYTFLENGMLGISSLSCIVREDFFMTPCSTSMASLFTNLLEFFKSDVPKSRYGNTVLDNAGM